MLVLLLQDLRQVLLALLLQEVFLALKLKKYAKREMNQ